MKHKERQHALLSQEYEPPSGEIAKHIESDFGSLDALTATFNAKTAAIQVA
jgi:superoxide dismutase